MSLNRSFKYIKRILKKYGINKTILQIWECINNYKFYFIFFCRRCLYKIFYKSKETLAKNSFSRKLVQAITEIYQQKRKRSRPYDRKKRHKHTRNNKYESSSDISAIYITTCFCEDSERTRNYCCQMSNVEKFNIEEYNVEKRYHNGQNIKMNMLNSFIFDKKCKKREKGSTHIYKKKWREEKWYKKRHHKNLSELIPYQTNYILQLPEETIPSNEPSSSDPFNNSENVSLDSELSSMELNSTDVSGESNLEGGGFSSFENIEYDEEEANESINNCVLYNGYINARMYKESEEYKFLRNYITKTKNENLNNNNNNNKTDNNSNSNSNNNNKESIKKNNECLTEVKIELEKPKTEEDKNQNNIETDDEKDNEISEHYDNSSDISGYKTKEILLHAGMYMKEKKKKLQMKNRINRINRINRKSSKSRKKYKAKTKYEIYNTEASVKQNLFCENYLNTNFNFIFVDSENDVRD